MVMRFTVQEVSRSQKSAFGITYRGAMMLLKSFKSSSAVLRSDVPSTIASWVHTVDICVRCVRPRIFRRRCGWSEWTLSTTLCKKEVIESVYGITEFTDHEDFLAQLATKMGRLNKCNTPNLHVVAIQVINDWQRGKLPYFVPPPRDLEMQAAHATAEEDKQREADEAGMSLEQLAGLEEEEEEEEDEPWGLNLEGWTMG